MYKEKKYKLIRILEILLNVTQKTVKLLYKLKKCTEIWIQYSVKEACMFSFFSIYHITMDAISFSMIKSLSDFAE